MIVSFTAIPTRIHAIEAMVKSLLNQSMLPDKIYCWIPKVFKRKNVKWDGSVPEFLKDPLIEVVGVEDQGSITKLLPALELDHDVIITADDDVDYPKNWIKELMDNHKHLSEAVLCYRGRRFNQNRLYEDTRLIKCHQLNIRDHGPYKCDMITGTWGVLYLKKHFKDFKLEETTVDDILISAHLYNNNIDMYIIPGEACTPIEANKIDGLWWVENKDHSRNNEAIKKYYK